MPIAASIAFFVGVAVGAVPFSGSLALAQEPGRTPSPELSAPPGGAGTGTPLEPEAVATPPARAAEGEIRALPAPESAASPRAEVRTAPPEAAIASSDAKLTASESEGRKALARAQDFLKQAENTKDPAEQRRAYELGKEQAERAVTLLPNDAEAHFARFATTGRLAQLDGLAAAGFHLMSLQRELDRILELDPNHADALAARGGMLVKLPRMLGGDTQKGIVFLEKAVTLDDTAVGKRLELSEAYHLVGRDEEARTMAESALATAERIQKPEKVALCKRFMEELARSCARCPIASIGR